ncbi:MAG TPA: hypothetical protein PK293_17085 [Spirochaetota bacterium]|nr:hypothetical protein [Spirochaetota bacterium]HPF07760.1 hypothetical protein [Spirochaetota bacterium]HPJ43936.1 hypothetical protein [Spirochaetota bacterium]HPR39157.1 hypothetical protein [Spirochaetota bacterium]
MNLRHETPVVHSRKMPAGTKHDVSIMPALSCKTGVTIRKIMDLRLRGDDIED